MQQQSHWTLPVWLFGFQTNSSADLVVDLGTGQERAVPVTKTVTAQLAAFAIIAQALGDLGSDDRAAAELPGQVDEVLADTAPPITLAQWLEGADRLVTVARGLLHLFCLTMLTSPWRFHTDPRVRGRPAVGPRSHTPLGNLLLYKPSALEGGRAERPSFLSAEV